MGEAPELFAGLLPAYFASTWIGLPAAGAATRVAWSGACVVGLPTYRTWEPPALYPTDGWLLTYQGRPDATRCGEVVHGASVQTATGYKRPKPRRKPASLPRLDRRKRAA